jgi:hypothetical protein
MSWKRLVITVKLHAGNRHSELVADHSDRNYHEPPADSADDSVCLRCCFMQRERRCRRNRSVIMHPIFLHTHAPGCTSNPGCLAACLALLPFCLPASPSPSLPPLLPSSLLSCCMHACLPGCTYMHPLLESCLFFLIFRHPNECVVRKFLRSSNIGTP